MWLTAGDKNSKFFHAASVTNRRKIFIPALKDSNGKWKENCEDIGNLLIKEFSNLFKADTLQRSKHLGHFITNCISNKDNVSMEVIPTGCEIWKMIQSMHLDKALDQTG